MKIGTTRVETFSDGVLAIIITIMVLELKVPEVSEEITSRIFRQQLVELLSHFVPYAFSFMMIGIFWVNHHHMFHLLEKTDEPLLLWNLLFLFWMSLIPLSTALVSASPKLPDSIAFYGFVMLATTVSFAVMRSHTLRKSLMHKDADDEMTREVKWVSVRGRNKTIIGAAAYLCALPLAYVSIYAAYVCFAIAPIIFFIPDGIDNEQLANKVEEKNA